MKNSLPTIILMSFLFLIGTQAIPTAACRPKLGELFWATLEKEGATCGATVGCLAGSMSSFVLQEKSRLHTKPATWAATYALFLGGGFAIGAGTGIASVIVGKKAKKTISSRTTKVLNHFISPITRQQLLRNTKSTIAITGAGTGIFMIVKKIYEENNR